MKMFIIKNKLFKILTVTGALCFWVLLWQFAAFYIDDEFFLPKPYDVLLSLIENLRLEPVRVAVFKSLLRVLNGYILGVISGAMLAIITSKVALLRELFTPLLSVIRATPVVSFVILAFLLFDRDNVPSYIVVLMVMPIIWSNMTEGLSQIDRSLTEMSVMYNFSIPKKIRYLYIPAVLPYFASAAITAFGFAWKSGVAAEVICYPDDSIGKLIYRARVELDSVKVFALTAAVILISIILELLLKKAFTRLKKYRQRMGESA